MIVLIPVSRFRVPYETARGRPYSGLEKAVLLASADDGATLRSLKGTFRVHERLLVEAAVTLVSAGWIAVTGGKEARFVLTAAGRQALDSNHDPVSVVVGPAKPQTILMERVTGQLARHADARSWSKRDLGELMTLAVVMRERIFRNALDEAHIQKLLPSASGEWVRRIGPISLTSRRTHFLPVNADIETGRVRGLPPDWYDALAGRVLQRARTAAEKAVSVDVAVDERYPTAQGKSARILAGIGGAAVVPSKRGIALQVTRENIRVGPAEHAGFLVAALAEARTSVVIVSPLSDEPTFRQVAAQAAEAVCRGVRIDLLVGATAPGTEARSLIAAANEIGYRADNRDGRARLRTREEPTGSGVSLVVYDNDVGRLVALISDHPWLSENASASASTGLVITQQGICADLARAISSLWLGRRAGNPRWAGPAERWRTMAAEIGDRAAVEEAAGTWVRTTTADTTAEILVDDEIAAPDSNTDTTARVGVGSDDASGGEGAIRGLVLRITGEGASKILDLRAAMLAR